MKNNIIRLLTACMLIMSIWPPLNSKASTTGTISTVAGTGENGFAGDGGPATDAQLGGSTGVTVDTSGNIYIADYGNHRVRKVDSTTGTISTVAGTGVSGSAGDGGPATDAQLSFPRSVTVDASGNLYIADSYNFKIRKVDSVTGTISTVAGTGVVGSDGDGGPATDAQLGSPDDVIVDASGSLYIADSVKNKIRKVDSATGTISTVAGTGVSGSAGDGGLATDAQLYYPTGITIDVSGNLYIADVYNNKIRKVDSVTGTISTVAGTGVVGSAGDGGLATDAQFTYPMDVTVDASGNLYIADSYNCKIRRVDSVSGTISTVTGTGEYGFAGDGGPATDAQLSYLQGVTVDASSNLYIADTENSRIRKVMSTVTTTAPTVTTNINVINVTETAALVGGEVTANGSAEITERGIVYATTANPTTSGSKVTATGTTGPFTANLTGLTANTTYHYRAYATNTAGTSYGTDQTFTTAAAVATYTVSYDGNGSDGGTVPTDSSTYQAGESVTVAGNSGNFVKTGYTFAGWNTKADGTGTDYATGSPYTMGSANVTLYAKWTANPKYTVTYDGNGNTGGTVPTDSSTYQAEESVTVAGNTGNLVKLGYTFAGWNTAADGTGTDYAAAGMYTMGSANVTLYAKWTANPKYTVTYNGNGATGLVPIENQTYEEAASVTVAGNTGNLVKLGYTFAGWNTVADGTGTDYAAGSPYTMGSANVTLYAKWTANPKYTVTYDGNGNTGGTVPTDSSTYQAEESVTVSGNSGNLVKTGYTFAGWNTAADGTGTDYTAGSPYTMGSANVTLYAKWMANPKYTVTYDGNGNTGGTVPTDSSIYQAGESVTVAGNTGNLVKLGYTFAGWNTAADGTGTNYAAASTYTMGSANVTLYAKWTANPKYTVTYNGNGATGLVPIDNQTYEEAASVTVAGNTGNLVKLGYKFAGWNTAADGTGTDYTAGSIYTMGSANVTLYAKWTANPKYTVTYDGNGNIGGTVPTDSSTYQAEESVTVSGNSGNLVKTGYTFAGWNTKADGTGSDYTAGSPYTIGSANVTLYAKWTANPKYTVIYDGNGNTGGTVPTDSSTYQEEESVTVSGNSGNLVKTGYTFAGWNTKADGTGTDYAATSMYTMGSANVTLYAQWKLNSYTVTFNSNDGTLVESQPVNYGETAAAPTSPKKTGYTFAGWYSDADLTTAYEFATEVTSDFTLYAKWNVVPSSGGSTPSTPSTPSTNVEEIKVDVDGGNGDNLTQTPIERTTETDGTVKDNVTMSDTIAKETVQKAQEQGIDTARIVIPDATDKVAETRVDIPKTALSELNNGKINLEISTDNVVISIPTNSLENVTDDLYFRVVPIKTEPERQQVEERANNEEVVQEVAKGLTVQVLGRPMTIETNMSNHPVDLVLPLKGVTIPEQADQREAFFDKLGVFIEHSDGEKVFTKGEVVQYKNGELGLKFRVTKFSTFTIISIPNTAPTATNVKITGSPKVGSILKGAYQYKDADSDLEGTSLFKWYRADNAAGKNIKAIADATKSTYKTTSADKGKYISLEVTPVAKTGETTGVATNSNYVGSIQANTVPVKNYAPIVTNLKITGKAIVGSTLKATYRYKDADKDQQGKSTIQWYRIDPKTNKKTAIKGANKITYKVTSNDEGKKIAFEVRPIAKTGIKIGKKATSQKTVVIEVEYKSSFKLGAIKNKAYAERLVSILEKTYKAKNVTLKKNGGYYRISACFVDKNQANKVGKDMIKKKLIIYYYITSR